MQGWALMGRGKGGRASSEAGIVVAPTPPSPFSLLDSSDLSLRSQLEPVEV